MNIERKIIDTLDFREITATASLSVKNCIINKIDFSYIESSILISIENCIITSFLIHSSWFIKGLIFKNNQIENVVDYQMGGHNKYPIYFNGNIFYEFVNFFDCQFEELIEVKRNLFLKDTNLLGNVNEGYKNTFMNGYVVEENIGDVALGYAL